MSANRAHPCVLTSAGRLCRSPTNSPAHCCMCGSGVNTGCLGSVGRQGPVSLVIVGLRLTFAVRHRPRGCCLCHEWALAVSNLFLRSIVTGHKWPCSPIPSIFQRKRGGEGSAKPELNLPWQLLQSSRWEGGPSPCVQWRTASRVPTKGGPASPQVRSAMSGHASRDARQCTSEWEKERREPGGQAETEWKITKWQEATKHQLGDEKEKELFWPQNSNSLR